MKGFCSVLLPPFANVSGQIVTKLPVLTPLCYGYIHTATGARLARKKKIWKLPSVGSGNMSDQSPGRC
uniref:Putative secreted protein n=1 Tax=Ixodes ricinus TaxID=34613 RepID=A0A147BVR8_IXORI